MKNALAMTKQEIKDNRAELRALYDRKGLNWLIISLKLIYN